jgi:uncharacterized protein (DUF433 family)
MSERCSICSRPFCPVTKPWDQDTHCPRSMSLMGVDSSDRVPLELCCERDCLRIGLELRDARLAKTKDLLARVQTALTDGAALLTDHGAELPRYQTAEMTSARIERQDRENITLRTRLAELGERTEEASDVLLVVTRAGRHGGSPTVGHSRLPLAQIVGQIRAGDTIESLRRCWGSYPDETWRVCIALARELMPVPEPDEVEHG